ncbi:MAG: hypothetical protein KGY80_03030 [Candidatus Thorarchaeota archaeon]|nr:hypothetical protein [Candidatus Thorarchaeota archaeon]
MTDLENGTYYFRVRAVDSFGVSGAWSNVENITVSIPSTTTTTTTTETTTETTTTTTTTAPTTGTGPFGLPETIFGIDTWLVLAAAGIVVVLLLVVLVER